MYFFFGKCLFGALHCHLEDPLASPNPPSLTRPAPINLLGLWRAEDLPENHIFSQQMIQAGRSPTRQQAAGEARLVVLEFGIVGVSGGHFVFLFGPLEVRGSLGLRWRWGASLSPGSWTLRSGASPRRVGFLSSMIASPFWSAFCSPLSDA